MLSEFDFIIRLLFASLLGALVGFEREQAHKVAGLRTHSLIALGSCLFTLISIAGFKGDVKTVGFDPSRIISNILVAVGFIGAGAVLRQESRVVGITTAASLWVVAAVGVVVGFGFYLVAIFVSLLTLFILGVLWKIENRIIKYESIARPHDHEEK